MSSFQSDFSACHTDLLLTILFNDPQRALFDFFVFGAEDGGAAGFANGSQVSAGKQQPRHFALHSQPVRETTHT